MRRLLSACLLVLCLTYIGWCRAEEKPLTAQQILEKADWVVNEPKDQSLKVKLVLLDSKGREEIREFSLFQKGSDKRMGRFLAPADQKGIGFLALPNNVTYLYLPAFKKTRRIASHVKNQKFAGTDFTYEDMEVGKFSEKWLPKLLKSDGDSYFLELTPKPETETDYGKVMLQIRADIFFPIKIDYFDRQNKPAKVMTRDRVEKVSGYWVAGETVMEDLKTGHKTKMIIVEAKFDTGLTDDIFTERYLSR